MSKRFPDHLHKYKRVDLGNKYLVFKCMVPSCSHYVPLKLAEGKLCECNRCGNPMVITKANVDLARPHCIDCTKRKKEIPVEAVAEFLSKTGSGS